MKNFNLGKVAVYHLTTLILLSASIVFLAGNTWAQQTQDPDYGIELQNNSVCSFITGNNVNIRSGPGSQYQAISRLNRGDGVRATHTKGNWVAIAARVYGYVPNETFKPLNGWVSNAYINGCSEDKFDMWRN